MTKVRPAEVIAYFGGGMVVSSVFLALGLTTFAEVKAGEWLQFAGTVMAMTASAFFVWWQVRRQHVLQMAQLRNRELQEELRILSAFVGVACLGSSRLDAAKACIADSNGSAAVQYFKVQRLSTDIDIIDKAMILTDAKAMSAPNLTLATLAVLKHFRAACFALDAAAVDPDAMYAAVTRGRLLNDLKPHMLTMSTNIIILMAREGAVLQELGRPLNNRHIDAMAHVHSMDAAALAGTQAVQ